LRSRILLIAIIGLGALVRLLNGPRPYDDAYITFRYVENIVNGIGFVYNEGEKVLGTTTPLWTLLLSVLYFPFRFDLGWLALLTSTIADSITIWLLWALGRKLLGQTRFGFEYFAPLLFAISIFSVSWCVGGMETSLFTMLLVSTFYLALDGKYIFAAATAAFATLARPEGILMLGLALVFIWLVGKRWPWRETLLAALIGLPWAIFATLYYGSPIPHSVTAKGDKVYIFAETGLARLKQFSLIAWDNPFGQFITNLKLPEGRKIFILGLVATFIFFALVLPGIWRIWKTNHAALIIGLGFPLLFNLAYILAQFRDVLIFDWYLVPLVPWYLLLSGLGLYQYYLWLEKLVARRREKSLPVLHMLVSPALILLIVVCAVNQFQAYDGWRARISSPVYYQEAARLIESRLKPTDTIIAPEIGMLGYFAKARIFDSVGLISPGALKYYPVPPNELASNNAIPSRMVLEVKPEYVISLELFVRNSLKLSPEFMSTYTLLYKVSTNQYGSDGLLVFVRNDLR
jgi:hypothetical protein